MFECCCRFWGRAAGQASTWGHVGHCSMGVGGDLLAFDEPAEPKISHLLNSSLQLRHITTATRHHECCRCLAAMSLSLSACPSRHSVHSMPAMQGHHLA